MANEDEILRCAQDDTVKHLRGMRITADGELSQNTCYPIRHPAREPWNGSSVLSRVPVMELAADGFFLLRLSLPGPVLFPEVGAGEQFFGAFH